MKTITVIDHEGNEMQTLVNAQVFSVFIVMNELSYRTKGRCLTLKELDFLRKKIMEPV